MTDLRAEAINRTASTLRALWQAAPESVRPHVAALGVALRAGEASPMVTMDRAGALLREQWPAGFEVAARSMPMWAMVEARPRA